MIASSLTQDSRTHIAADYRNVGRLRCLHGWDQLSNCDGRMRCAHRATVHIRVRGMLTALAHTFGAMPLEGPAGSVSDR
jgi:hypothetical protein